MPLNQKEKDGFREILQNLDQDDLIALKDTVTNRLIAARSKHEAIQVILVYTNSALQLLKRKKLKRDFIFGYLATKGVAVPSNEEKSKLIRTVLTYWNGHEQPALPDFNDDEDDANDQPRHQPNPGQAQPRQRGDGHAWNRERNHDLQRERNDGERRLANREVVEVPNRERNYGAQRLGNREVVEAPNRGPVIELFESDEDDDAIQAIDQLRPLPILQAQDIHAIEAPNNDDDVIQFVEQFHQTPAIQTQNRHAIAAPAIQTQNRHAIAASAIQTQNRHAIVAPNRNNNTAVNAPPIAAPAPPGPLAPAPQAAPPATITAPSMTQELAIQFVTWFFQQLNGLNPQMAKEGALGDWGPQHFFNDCKLNLNLQSQDSRMDRFEGAELVSERFRDLVQSEGLLFNPNLEADGTKGINDPHGLVLVFVCGTIHREGSCLGVFEQRFGLVRDPLKQNNWKIKFTDVNVKSDQSVSGLPRLGSASNFPAITGVL